MVQSATTRDRSRWSPGSSKRTAVQPRGRLTKGRSHVGAACRRPPASTRTTRQLVDVVVPDPVVAVPDVVPPDVVPPAVVPPVLVPPAVVPPAVVPPVVVPPVVVPPVVVAGVVVAGGAFRNC